MKRSEMVENLFEFIDSSLFTDMEREQVEELLSYIESLGMLPPAAIDHGKWNTDRVKQMHQWEKE